MHFDWVDVSFDIKIIFKKNSRTQLKSTPFSPCCQIHKENIFSLISFLFLNNHPNQTHPSTYYVAIYKTIHVYYLNMSHDLLIMSYDYKYRYDLLIMSYDYKYRLIVFFYCHTSLVVNFFHFKLQSQISPPKSSSD